MGVGREGKPFFIYFFRKREKEAGRILLEHAYAHARGERKEAGHKTQAGRKARDTRHEGEKDHKEEH